MSYDYDNDEGFGCNPEEDWHNHCTQAEVTTNFTISKSDNNTYLVRGDSERFGKNAILFESFKKSEYEAYVKRNGQPENVPCIWGTLHLSHTTT